MNNITNIKYLNIDNYNKYGHRYIVRVNILGKSFVVWTGDYFWMGEMIAKKVQELMSISKAEFLKWYDNDRKEWLKKNGYKDANSKRPRNCL